MPRIADILIRVRDTLSDPSGDRWTDARLLRLVDEAQKDLAKRSLLLRTRIGISLLSDIATYEIADDCIHFLRFINEDGVPLTVFTHEQMDDLDSGWEIVTGAEVTHIIFDKLNPRRFKVYPIPSAVDDGDGEAFLTSDFGVVTVVDDDVVDDFGVTASITTSATLTATWNSDFGVLTDMSTIFQSMTVYYYKYPAEINAIDIVPSVLEIDAVYDKAIKNYVVGEALLDDKDTQDVTLGRSKKKEYREERKEASKDSSKDFNRAPQRATKYIGGFE